MRPAPPFHPVDPHYRPTCRLHVKRLGPGEPPRRVILYENGPIDGNTYAWEIDGLYNIVSDTFTLTGSSTITGISFGTWLYPGDTLYSVQIIISLAAQRWRYDLLQQSAFKSLESSGCVLNQEGFNVCTETVVNYFSIPELSPGTYWINLQNADVSNFGPGILGSE